MISEWEHFAQNSTANEAPKPPCRQKQSSAKKCSSRTQSKYNTIESSNPKPTSPLEKLVKIPVEILLKEWNVSDDFDGSEDEDIDFKLNRWSQNISGAATLAMKRVDFTLRKLRQSATIVGLQKSSLQVAVALLDLVSMKECQNPFLCLHQAALFASQGSKGGNYDEEFKKPLPEESECTPFDCLSILGRADCLRAIHFTNEAIFLCSYVAKVCRLHRDRKSDFPWTPKWRVIAILMYTISVAIDATICSFMEGETRRSALESWENEVKGERGRGRSDAIALQKTFASHTDFDSRKPIPTKGFGNDQSSQYIDDGVEDVEIGDQTKENMDHTSLNENIEDMKEREYEEYDDEEDLYTERSPTKMPIVNLPYLHDPIDPPLVDFNDEVREDNTSDKSNETDLHDIAYVAV